MFSVEDRDRVRSRVLELAATDPRLVAGAEILDAAVAGLLRESADAADLAAKVEAHLRELTRAG